jgi:hypothetical protein
MKGQSIKISVSARISLTLASWREVNSSSVYPRASHAAESYSDADSTDKTGAASPRFHAASISKLFTAIALRALEFTDPESETRNSNRLHVLRHGRNDWSHCLSQRRGAEHTGEQESLW